MPDTSSTSWGCRSSPASACLMAARMPKSPQPGHQVDLSPPLKIFSSDIRHLPGERCDHLVRRDRSPVVLVDSLVGLPTGQPAQVVGELAGVVLLDDHHPPDFLQLGADDVLVERE